MFSTNSRDSFLNRYVTFVEDVKNIFCWRAASKLSNIYQLTTCLVPGIKDKIQEVNSSSVF